MKRGVEAGNIVVGANTFIKGGLNGWWIPIRATGHQDHRSSTPNSSQIQKTPARAPSSTDRCAGAVVTSQIFKGFGTQKAGGLGSSTRAPPPASTVRLQRLTSARRDGSSLLVSDGGARQVPNGTA